MNTTTKFNFTSDQQLAALKILSFLGDNEENVFLLEGYSGTGKTTLCNYVVEKWAVATESLVAVSAFTNIATNLIGEKTPFADAVSLFSMIGLVTDRDDMVLKFEKKMPGYVHEYKLIILDEVSMVEDKYLKTLMTMCRKSGTKLLLMGDPAQLPPVGQNKDSFAFTEIENKYCLTEIVRQSSDSDIPKYGVLLREKIENYSKKSKKKVSFDFDCEKGDLEFTRDYNRFIEEAVELFKSEEYKSDKDYVRVLAYKNNTVNQLNYVIRKRIFGDNVEGIRKGETIILNSPIYENDECIFNTSDQLIVECVYVDEKTGTTVNVQDFNWLGVAVYFEYFNVRVKRISDGKTHNITIVSPDQKTEFELMMYSVGLAIRKQKSKKQIFQDEYWVFRDIFNAVGYTYATTVHKAQGKTLSNVFVMGNDITSVKIPNKKNLYQALYVAVTRPTTKCVVY